MILKQRLLISGIDYCSAAKASQKPERYRAGDRAESNFVSRQVPSSLHRLQLGEIKIHLVLSFWARIQKV
jgi:hypothetical protein